MGAHGGGGGPGAAGAGGGGASGGGGGGTVGETPFVMENSSASTDLRLLTFASSGIFPERIISKV